MPTTTLADRLVLGAVIVLTCCLFLPAAADPVNQPKLTVLIWAAITLLALAAARALLDRQLSVPWGWPALAGLALLAAFTCAALVSPVGTVAVIGTYGRNSGFLAYSCGLTLFLIGSMVLRRRSLLDVELPLLVAGTFTALYGLLQAFHHDPIHWSNPFNPIIGSLGNPDFASAYLGICTPVAVAFAIRSDVPRGARIGSGLLAALLLGTALASTAIQGPLAAAAGLVVLLIASSLDLRSTARRASLTALVGVASAAVAVSILGLTGRGPGAAALSGSTFRARSWYWESALRMLERHPITGVGLDAYGMFFRQVRPIGAARLFGGNEFSDAAHSVPLQMAAQGGIILAAAYLLFVGTIVMILLRGLRAARGSQRLRLGGVGGAWVASQVQSWVSIDQVPLITAQFVLAAAVVVAAGGTSVHTLSIGKPHPSQTQSKGGRGRPPTRRAPVSGSAWAGLAAVAVGAVALGWVGSRPLRADMRAHAGDVHREQGLIGPAAADYARAAQLMPGVSRYWARIAGLENSRGNTQAALQAYAEATNHDPYDVDAWRNEGRLAEALGDLRVARFSFARAAKLDPTNDATLLDQATFELRHGGAALARQSLTTGVRLLPRSAGLWATLGDAQLVLGDRAGARSSYQRALTLAPGEPTATKGLAQLTKPPT